MFPPLCSLPWDRQNRLVFCVYNGTTSIFTYGADGLRRSSTVGGITTYYVYDGSTLIREMMKNAQGAFYNTATYLTGPRGPEYRRDDTQTELDSQGRTVSKTRWYVYDGLGSVVGEVDPNGTLTSSPKYDVYGLVRANSGTASSKMGFVGGLGHLSEANTGLIYMRARYYDPNNGRFASEDGNRNGRNWFIYADDNPIDKVDATGKSATDAEYAAFGMMLFLFGGAVSAIGQISCSKDTGEFYETVKNTLAMEGAGSGSGLLGILGGAVATMIGAGLTLKAGADIIGDVALMMAGITIALCGEIIACGGEEGFDMCKDMLDPAMESAQKHILG